MKLTFDRYKFAAAFTAAAGAVPARTPKDVLRNVHMKCSAGSAELTGTDMDVSVAVRCPVTEDVECEVLLPTQKMSQILRETTDDQIVLDIGASKITVKTSSGKFTLTTEDAKDFPPVLEFSDVAYWEVDARVFRTSVKRTTFATDEDSTRYALGGVNIEAGETGYFLATDSRRLAVAQAAFKKVGDVRDVVGANVAPSKALVLMDRIIGGGDQDVPVKIAILENTILLQHGTSVVTCRKIEGRFPRWRDVIPQAPKFTVPLPVGPFGSVLRQSLIMTSEEHRGVVFRFSNGVLSLRSSGAGESDVEMPIGLDSAGISITFDPSYLVDLTKVLPPEGVLDCAMVDGDTGALFTTENYRYVLMPLQS
jgi:DNA polymerase-3 subunit beta